MFEIEYKGGNGVIISTKKLRVVCDPKLSIVGLSDLSVKGAVQLATEPRFVVDDTDAHLTIEGPGEYEVGDFSIRGIPATRHIDADPASRGTTMYRISVGDVGVALIGNIASNLDDEQLELIGVVDVLIVPVGGAGYTLDGAQATQIARQIEPKVVIPIHYAENGVSYEVPQDALKVFTDEIGVDLEVTDKYKLKSVASLPQAMTVVEVKRS